MIKKLFLSYARVDGSDFANTLYQDLEARGFDVWLDIEDIEPGTDWDSAIDQVLESTQVAMVIVLTPGSVLSPQVKSEWQDAINRHLPVIPLLVKDCEVPRLLKIFNYIDFQRGYNVGLAQLRKRLGTLANDHVKHLESQIARYTEARNLTTEKEKQGFDSKIASLEIALLKWKQPFAEDAEYISPTTVNIQGVRFASVDGYIGRNKEKRRILDFLSGPERLLIVTGEHGVGKTALISRVIQEVLDNAGLDPLSSLDSIILLSTKTTGINIRLIIDKFATVLGGNQEQLLRTIISDQAELDRHSISQFIKIIRRGHHILVLDGMDTIIDSNGRITDREIKTFIGNMIVENTNTKVIVTSRTELAIRQEIREQCSIMQLQHLSEGDALAYIRELDPNGDLGLRDTSEDELRQILAQTSRNPGSLEHFVDVLRSNPFMTPKDALEYITKED